MAEIVSLDFVKRALRVAEFGPDGEVLEHEDDLLLQNYIDTATEAVLRYLKGKADPDWTEETAPKAVHSSIVLAVQSLYDPDRTDLIAGLGVPDPKNPIVALLCMMRKPTVA